MKNDIIPWIYEQKNCSANSHSPKRINFARERAKEWPQNLSSGIRVVEVKLIAVLFGSCTLLVWKPKFWISIFSLFLWANHSSILWVSENKKSFYSVSGSGLFQISGVYTMDKHALEYSVGLWILSGERKERDSRKKRKCSRRCTDKLEISRKKFCLNFSPSRNGMA